MTFKTPIPYVLRSWAKRQGFDCADINSHIENAMTPLMLACMDEELVDAGADISRQTLDGYTVLDSATTLSILKYLKPLYSAESV